MGNLNDIIAGIGNEAHTRVKFGAGHTTGATGAYTLFNVTGTVAVRVIAVLEADIAGGSATLELGTAKSTAGLIAQSTGTDLDNAEIWHDATPDAGTELSTVAAEKIVTDDIILTIATAAVTGGTIRFNIIWRPLSSDGHLASVFNDSSASPSQSPSASRSPSASLSPSASASISPSTSLSPSTSRSPSTSASASASPSASRSPSASTSPSSSVSPSPDLF